MRIASTRHLLAALFGTLSLAASHCSQGSGGSQEPAPAPTSHRPTAAACPSTRGPGVNDDAGLPVGAGAQCTSDSQCTAGKNGRCTAGGNAAPICTYDACFTDSDCPKGDVCACGQESGSGREPNVCLEGNCTVDSDCGAGGYCSPSYGTTCGAFLGVVGYYCHTPHDQCTNDNQCTAMPGGYCGWQPTSDIWTCFYGLCAG